MLTRLVLRNVAYRPWRSLLLFVGYGIGVGVMIVLLAIGEALLTQARDERLIGGGTITVLPEGLDVEAMKTGGLGGRFVSIDHSRFIYRQLLASPRLSDVIRAAAPQIEGKLLYLRTRRGGEIAVRASGDIPDATRAVGAAPSLVSGSWTNDDGDRRYVAPTRAELDHELDHFHLPPELPQELPQGHTARRDSWAEWHYFNVLSADTRRWAFLSFIVGGDVSGKRWGGRVAITLVGPGGRPRRYASVVPSSMVRFSTTAADVRIGSSSVTVLPDGRYAVHGSAAAEATDATAGTPSDTSPAARGARRHEGVPHEGVTVDLVVTPARGAYFPGTALGTEDFVSGYVVPALRADATGTICEGGSCERYAGAQSYHDHNWGVWRGVTWDWGASRAGEYTLLYGRVIPPDGAADAPPLLVYLADSLGFLAVFRPRQILYTDARTVTVGGRSLRVPDHALFAAVRGDDTLRVDLDVEHATGTDTRLPLIERGDVSEARSLARPYFVQMKGTATIHGRVAGRVVVGRGTGFFETYR